MRHKTLAVVSIVLLLASLLASVSSAAVPTDTSELRAAVTVDGIMEHLEWLEGNGPRPSGSAAYLDAADYVYGRLLDAGYDVVLQDFAFDLWEELSDPVLEQTAPNPTVYPPYDDAGFATMEYSGDGDVTAEVVLADNLGCDPADFASADFTGKIALIERGVCYFSEKAINAEAAGAAAAIVFNDAARQDAFLGTLGGSVVSIPVVGSSYAVGQDLIGENVIAHIFVDAEMHFGVLATNVIAEMDQGRDDRVVLVGAHLDSVAAGNGINDNGSGVATILEIAEEMAELGIEPRNRVRFAFWGAEEQGLFGSEYYVSQLGKKGIKKIALNLNLDMVASPTYEHFVYDGDGSDTAYAGPTGSANVEDIFLDYFASQGLSTAPTELDGRSDYQSFADVGIPVGGLFTGAEGYDPCYHTPCDDITNINDTALDAMSDAAAHAVLTFAMTTSAVPGTAKASPKAMEATEFKGPRAQQ